MVGSCHMTSTPKVTLLHLLGLEQLELKKSELKICQLITNNYYLECIKMLSMNG